MTQRAPAPMQIDVLTYAPLSPEDLRTEASAARAAGDPSGAALLEDMAAELLCPGV